MKNIHMSNSNTVAEKAIHEPRAQRLAAASTLFEIGELSEEISNHSFILRLNTIVARRRADAEKNTPANLSDAISVKGMLHRHAELAAFGRWLLLDGHPGLAKQGGKHPNSRVILQCVAVALCELRIRPDLQKKDLAKAGRASRTREITKRDLAERWLKLLGEKKEPSFFDARLRSMKRILSAYLEHMKSGAFVVDGKQIKKSPEIEKVLKAITGKSKLGLGAKPLATTKPVTSVPAIPSPFEIELRYSSSAQEEEYRSEAGISLPLSRLRYLPAPASATSTTGEVRADRKDKIVLMPDVTIRGNYKVEALIDRMVILINTTTPTAPHYLQGKIDKTTGAKVYVHDLKAQSDNADWGSALPITELTTATGQHFAIMIQDPTPELLPAILNVIRDAHGIDETVKTHLIEVSVDFYPGSTRSAEDSILLREQMVGLLHRHHWAPHSRFHHHDPAVPRYVDARQIHGDRRGPRYLFAHQANDHFNSDSTIDNSAIRQRMLTDKPGEDLHLNSTLWKGAKNADCQVSIQHKIANRRNPKNNTMEILPDHERRARIEVTISGRDTLKDRGLSTIDDLGSVSFRKLTKPFLSFALGATEPWQHLLKDAQAQMQTRGVYGIELRNRARALEEREELRRSGQKLPRKNDHEGQGLRSWQEMNDVVGRALDGLQRRWSGFSWR